MALAILALVAAALALTAHSIGRAPVMLTVPVKRRNPRRSV